MRAGDNSCGGFAPSPLPSLIRGHNDERPGDKSLLSWNFFFFFLKYYRVTMGEREREREEK